MITIFHSFLGTALFYSLFAWGIFIPWAIKECNNSWGKDRFARVIMFIIWVVFAPILLGIIICVETYDHLTEE